MTRLTGEPTRSEPTAPRAGLRGRWWFSAGIFIVGMVVGVIAVGLLNVTTPAFVPGAGSPGATPQTRASFEIAAEAQVNAACLRVINDALDVQRALSGVGEAANDVDLQRLDDIVRQLQPVEPRLAEDLANCNVSTSVANPVPPSTPSSSPSPTADPTR